MPLTCAVMTDDERPAVQEPETPERKKLKSADQAKIAAAKVAKAAGWVAQSFVKASKPVVRRRVLVPIAILAGVGISYIATLGLHSLLARSGSTDAWAAAIGSVSTVVLVLVTAFSAYLTYCLLEAQRSGPRTAARETAIRELGIFIARNNNVFWTAEKFFPVDTSAAPPDTIEILKSRDGLTGVRDHLMEVFELLPDQFAKLAVLTLAPLVEAEQELHALAWPYWRKLRQDWTRGVATSRGKAFIRGMKQTETLCDRSTGATSWPGSGSSAPTNPGRRCPINCSTN